ncbi:hypothetical protein EAT51_07845 [Pseudoxanthomonas winnipegensis]|nr:hypothetical protein EA662_17480 [Pseudoxanthomonas winnipegensis]TAA42329.1 hypothetical protein EAT51_07845 [Pseudoxanthomonas winnipegensis]
MSSEATMTVAEFAVHRGCSDSYIRRMRRQGKLVMSADGKLIRVAASDALLDDVTDPVRGGDRSAGAEVPRQPLPTYAIPLDAISTQEAVRRERLARARTAELELGELSKELIRAKEAERAVFTLVRQALNAMMGMPSRLRATVAAESDPRACEALMEAEVRRIADDMRRGARTLLEDRREAAADAEVDAA